MEFYRAPRKLDPSYLKRGTEEDATLRIWIQLTEGIIATHSYLCHSDPVVS